MDELLAQVSGWSLGPALREGWIGTRKDALATKCGIDATPMAASIDVVTFPTAFDLGKGLESLKELAVESVRSWQQGLARSGRSRQQVTDAR
jgi:hypothetical protein